MYPTKKLSEICEKITDGTHQTPTYFDSGYIFLSSKNVTSGTINWDNIKYIDEKQHLEMYKRVAPRKGDILLAKNGTTGVAAIVDRDEIFDIYVSLALLRPKSEIQSEYLLYFINSSLAKRQFNSRLKGVGVPNLHLGEIKEVEIPLPPLSTQSRIVARLDAAFASIDEQISLLRANIADVENMRKSVLVETFDKNNYELLKISDIAEIINGGTPDTTIPDYWNGEIFWITPKDMGQLEHIYVSETSRKITREGVNNSSAKILPVNSVVLSSRAPIGHLAINTVPMCTNQGCKGLVPGDGLNHIYLYYFLLHSRDLLNSLGSGTTFKELSSTKLKEVEIPLLSLPRQHEIVAHLDGVFATTDALRGEYEVQIRDLETLKQSLLEKAFAGRLVPENEV